MRATCTENHRYVGFENSPTKEMQRGHFRPGQSGRSALLHHKCADKVAIASARKSSAFAKQSIAPAE